MWSLSGRLLGEGMVGPFSHPPDRVPCEEHRLESGCGEPLCAVSPLSQPGSIELEGLGDCSSDGGRWSPRVTTYVRCGAEHWGVRPCVMKSLLHLTLFQVKCHGLLWCLPQQQAACHRQAAQRPPPGGPGDRRARGASLCTLTDALVGFAVWFFPWKNANFLSFISKLEIRGGVSQNFSAVKHECIN